MNNPAPGKTKWTCPECGRTYRLRNGRDIPELCKQCVRRNERAARSPGKVAPSAKSVTREKPAAPVADKALPAEVEAHIARKERERLLADIANISRTMTFFRRLVWGMIFMMLLNFVLIGAAFFYSMGQMSSLGGLFDGAPAGQQNGRQADGPGKNGVPGLGAEQLKPFEDYVGTLNELLEEK